MPILQPRVACADVLFLRRKLYDKVCRRIPARPRGCGILKKDKEIL